jgi:hypothetical protein
MSGRRRAFEGKSVGSAGASVNAVGGAVNEGSQHRMMSEEAAKYVGNCRESTIEL